MNTTTLRHTNAVAIRLTDNAARWAAMTPEQQRERIRRAALHCQFHAEAVRMIAEGKYGNGKYTGEKVSQ